MILRRINVDTTCSKCGKPSAHKYCNNCRGDKNGIDNHYNKYERGRITVSKRNKHIYNKHRKFLNELCNHECMRCHKKLPLRPFFKNKNIKDELNSVITTVEMLCDECFNVRTGRKSDR